MEGEIPEGQQVKDVVYTGLNGDKIWARYDPNAPCRICGLPVIEASMSGTDVCPWCDCGVHRDGRRWTYAETIKLLASKK